MQDENLRKQEESVQKQEAMRRSKKSVSVDMTVTCLSTALRTQQGLSGLCEVTIKVVPIICQNKSVNLPVGCCHIHLFSMQANNSAVCLLYSLVPRPSHPSLVPRPSHPSICCLQY